MIEADGVLAVPGFLPDDVPVGHPAKLLAFGPAFEHDQEWVKRDLFFLFAQPGF
jgi:hypothetical protein